MKYQPRKLKRFRLNLPKRSKHSSPYDAGGLEKTDKPINKNQNETNKKS